MKIESDHAEIISGVRWGKTIGSPITLLIVNRDFKNWAKGMSSDPAFEGSIPPVTKPRPGHADLTGAIKYDHYDVRNILERSSARETAMRVALGAIAKKFLSEFNINIGSFVVRIGNITIQNSRLSESHRATKFKIQNSEKELLALSEKAEKSPVRCPDAAASKRMVEIINKAIKEGNSLGGIFEVYVIGAPVGLGSHIQWDRKLDGRLARALMSIQAIKGVEIGLGFEMGKMSGVEVMDEIFYNRKTSGVKREMIGKTPNGLRFTPDGFYRKTNNAGGIEGGMTNGMPIILRAAMKPIPTLRKPLRSVDIVTKTPIKAAYERSDICAVPAAAVVGEAMSALTIADAFLEKFGGDGMIETRRNYDSYMEHVKKF